MDVYKQYDIRGIYPKEINENFTYKLGLALPKKIGKNIIVGRDDRKGSIALKDDLIKGLLDAGANVTDIGVISTPIIYFASFGKAAIMITASHNPPEYTGFKVVKNGSIIPGTKLKGLIGKKTKKGKLNKKDITKEYVNWILKHAKKTKKARIVVDFGSGVGAMGTIPVLNKIKANYISLHAKPDAKFPYRNPNPLHLGALDGLKAKIKETKADFGAALDGDGDRIVFVDEKGTMIEPDLIIALLQKKFKGVIAETIDCSKIVKEAIEKTGNKCAISQVGHYFIKEKMKQTKAVFGGEASGHYYYRELGYVDNSDLTLLLVLSLYKKPFSSMFKQLQKYHKQNFTIPVSKNWKQKLMKIGGKQTTIDGIRADFDKWWFIARESNTEPIIRVSVEAENTKLLNEKIKEVKKALK